MAAEAHDAVLWPRDRYDWRILVASYALLVPLAVVAVLGWCALPALLTLQLTHSVGAAIAVALAMDAVFIGYFASRIVRRVRTDDTGVMLDRCFGTSVFVPWSDVQDCETVDRAAYVRDAWFRLPPPLQSLSLSVTGQYRLRWRGGSAYFPPRNAEAFDRAMRRTRAAATSSESWYRSASGTTVEPPTQSVGSRRWWS